MKGSGRRSERALIEFFLELFWIYYTLYSRISVINNLLYIEIERWHSLRNYCRENASTMSENSFHASNASTSESLPVLKNVDKFPF